MILDGLPPRTTLTKGHGTENDFVIVPDLDGELEISAAEVAKLCDRRAGIGADGLLRVVRTAKMPGYEDQAAQAEFFMDYRNADGSVAEMCGNGIRVFLQYLIVAGLVETDAAVATRGGIRRARTCGDGNVTVHMGLPRFLADRPVATAAYFPPTPGTAVEMPNPHVVVPVATVADLEALDLSRPPAVEPPLPHGQNVEFVVRTGPRRLQMRVHERGVGETRSCGTGICAAAVAVAADDGVGADGQTWRVDVPGGSCEVVWHPDGEVELIGPAVLVAEVEVDEGWLRGR
jgi:diaminopimelate epimerase